MTRRILLLCDAFLGPGSGAAASRTAAAQLTKLGFEVTAFGPVIPGLLDNLQSGDYAFLPQPPFRAWQHLFPGDVARAFDQLVARLAPEAIFILGSTYNKPVCMFESATRSGARTIYMPWNQDFYCARSYGCLRQGPCTRCVDGSFHNALVFDCANILSGTAGAAMRSRLRKVIGRIDKILCSSADQAEALSIYLDRPIAEIGRCPLFFDPVTINREKTEDGDYFVYYAQAVEAKGWHLLPEIIRNCPETRFVLCPPGGDEREVLSHFPELRDLVDGARVSFVAGLKWQEGLEDLVAKSRGVLIPSIWPTTTEYVLLESLGLGKPVIAFNVGIHKEALQHKKNGMVAPVANIERFSQCIKELDRDPHLRAALSREGRLTFEKLVDSRTVSRVLQEALAGLPSSIRS